MGKERKEVNETLEYCRDLINSQPLVFSDYVGFTGVLLLIVTYAMLQLDKIDPKGFWYSFNNMIVAILVTFSLLVTMNKASMVIEVFWFIISVYGLIMYYKRRNESN